MKIKISNIGKIKEADVTINGITVIAGENNTGKSTVGKALYSIFNSFVDVKKKVDEERIDSVRRSLYTLFQEISGSDLGFSQIDVNSIAAKLNEIRNTVNQTELVKILITELGLKENAIKKNNDRFEISISKIMRALKVEDDNYLKILAQKVFSEEFKQQINNALESEAGKIDLFIRKSKSVIAFGDSIVYLVDKKIDVFSEAIYLDDPFILDVNPIVGLVSPLYSFGHKAKLAKLVYEQNANSNLVDTIVTGERLKKIIEKVHTACKGTVFFKNNSELVYQQDNMSVPFKVANLSAGLKTFVILQTLLLNGAIKDGSLIILDEPEIHLHPEWQLLFAELIVMLQKEFNLHILLNTHSPYFLQAIEVFAEKYGIEDKCEYYLAYNKHEESLFKCVTGNLEEIYAKLAKPLQTLENLRYADNESME